MAKKLTLNIFDEHLIKQAKDYAETMDLSLSRLVEGLLLKEITNNYNKEQVEKLKKIKAMKPKGKLGKLYGAFKAPSKSHDRDLRYDALMEKYS